MLGRNEYGFPCNFNSLLSVTFCAYVTRTPGGPLLGYPGTVDDYASGEPWQAIAPLRYINERAGTIYAGTNEIQRRIIAKAELGL